MISVRGGIFGPILNCKECDVSPILIEGYCGVVCLCPGCGKQLDLDRWNKENQEGYMEEKVLGKISYCEFGQYKDMPFLFGLQLGFDMNGSVIYDGSKYTFNISKECRWTREKKLAAMEISLEHINSILTDAKVNHVSQLIGKPVEITLENNIFKNFRILT